jgi:hypothetical protein
MAISPTPNCQPLGTLRTRGDNLVCLLNHFGITDTIKKDRPYGAVFCTQQNSEKTLFHYFICQYRSFAFDLHKINSTV